MIYSPQLYNLTTKETIKIPLPDSLFVGLKYAINKPNKEYNIPEHQKSSTKILDAILMKNNIYRVLYIYMNDLFVLDFDINNIYLNRKINIETSTSNLNSFPLFVFNEHYILMNRENKNEISLKYIE